MKYGIAVVILVFTTTTALAELVLTPGSSELQWSDPTNDPSPVLVLSVDNPQGLTESFFGWTLNLQVTPRTQAIGSVQFNTIATAPTGYVFDGRANLFNSNTSPATIISASDLDFSALSGGLPPVQVPTAGVNLVDIDFLASPDASGLFDIALLPFQSPDIGSFWTDGAFQARPFEDAANGNSIVLTTIAVGNLVSVAEPPMLLIWTTMLVVGLLWWRHRHHLKPA